MKQIFVFFSLLCCIGYSSFIYGQSRQQVYNNTVDQINCEVSRLLLRSFDRPVAARNIQDCRFASVLQEVQRVKENKVIGYRDDIISIISAINNFKSKVGADDNLQYVEDVLQDVKDFSLDNFQQICTNYKQRDNRICQDMQQKAFKLENQINAIIDQSLVKMGQASTATTTSNNTNVGTTVTEPVPVVEEEESSGWFFNRKKSADNTSTETVTYTNEDTSNSSGGTSWFITIILALLTIAVGWLFKENYDLKEEVGDLKKLLKTFTQRR